jgi:G3E family GTPase
MSAFISVYGAQMLRYKGVLYVKGQPQRGIFQGVHMLLGGDMGKPWGKDEKKESVLVFIGKNLPQETFTKGLTNCLVK